MTRICPYGHVLTWGSFSWLILGRIAPQCPEMPFSVQSQSPISNLILPGSSSLEAALAFSLSGKWETFSLSCVTLGPWKTRSHTNSACPNVNSWVLAHCLLFPILPHPRERQYCQSSQPRGNLKGFPDYIPKSFFFLLPLTSQPLVTALIWASTASPGLLQSRVTGSLFIFNSLQPIFHTAGDISYSVASYCTENKIQAPKRGLHSPPGSVLHYVSKTALALPPHHILALSTVLWPIYPSFNYFIISRIFLLPLGVGNFLFLKFSLLLDLCTWTIS